MQIRVMRDADLEDVAIIDSIAFEREEPRTIENCKALKESDPDGCFVIENNGEIIGYCYLKSLGNEGYIGPLGVKQEYQNNGYGKALISKTVEYLKSRCDVIGLEVLPETGSNIGIYQKMGFISGFPSLRFEFPDEIEHSSDNFSYMRLSDFLGHEQLKILDKMDLWTKNSFEGVSYKNDLISTLRLKGQIITAFKNKDPVGFMAYSKTLMPHIWGCVKPHNRQEEILKGILVEFNRINDTKDILIEVNARYNLLINSLIEMDFKVSRSINRMLLEGYEGNYLDISDKMSFRCWIG